MRIQKDTSGKGNLRNRVCDRAEKDCYFAGFQDGKILCRSFEYARYFSNTHSAEQFVKEYLGYAGLRCNLCKVAWGLAVHGLEPGWKENLKPYKTRGRSFSSRLITMA